MADFVNDVELSAQISATYVSAQVQRKNTIAFEIGKAERTEILVNF